MNIQQQAIDVIGKEYAITPDILVSLFEDELLTEKQSKKYLIRHEYLNSSSKMRLTEIKEDLADKYCVSLSTVEKYLAGV